MYGWQRALCGGWVAQVEQRRYGHRADKLTWLYAFNVEPPTLKWGRNRGLAQVHCSSAPGTQRRGRNAVEYMHKKERSSTPIEFRDLLLSIARSAVTELTP